MAKRFKNIYLLKKKMVQLKKMGKAAYLNDSLHFSNYIL